MNNLYDFKEFVNRVYEKTKFKAKELYKHMMVEIQIINKQDYFEIFSLLKSKWLKYKKNDAISSYLLENYQEFFSLYLTKFFPFQLERLKCGNAEALTPIDFKLVLLYKFNESEIQTIETLKNQYKIKEKTNSILKRIFVFSIFPFGRIIEQIYKKPFGCQLAGIYENMKDIRPKERIQIQKGEFAIYILLRAQ